jgi:CDP-4-dehydro-6-deoxyglucose reductase, E1
VKSDDAIVQEIDELVTQLWQQRLARSAFAPGKAAIAHTESASDDGEMRALVRTSLEFQVTAGPVAEEFERALAAMMSTQHSLFVNSAASADLCAISSLASRELERRLRRGDEVIIAATASPRTVNPIIQNGWTPVFVDVELGSYNTPLDYIEAALSPKTRAVVLRHAMGFPFDADALAKFCRQHSLFLVEDCSESLGATVRGKRAGTFGDLATLSFGYGQQMMASEGGAVLASNEVLGEVARSNRDHFESRGLDLQAALGLERLKKLPSSLSARRENWAAMRKHMEKFEVFFVLPETTDWMEPSPVGLVLTVREDAPFTKEDVTEFLEEKRIQTRGLAGNVLQQPAYETLDCRIAMPLVHSDAMTVASFLVGVHPGVDEQRRDYILAMLDQFLALY